MGAFAVQVATRVRLIAAAPNTFSLDHVGVRVSHFLVDVSASVRRFASVRSAGLAHAFVFWGFIAFGGYTTTEFLHGLGIVDLTGTALVHVYRMLLTPFAVAVSRNRVPADSPRVRPAGRARHEGLGGVDRDRAASSPP